MHHPWRAFGRLVDWTLRWAQLPGDLLGLTDFETRTVTLDPRQLQAERRCTIEHERQHAIRGPVPEFYWSREERAVDSLAARELLPDIRAVGEALAWAGGCLATAADELWVDEPTLRARLEHLHPAERHYLTRRLGEE